MNSAPLEVQRSTTPPENPLPTPPPSPPSNKKPLIILGIIVLGTILLYSAYFLGKSQSNPNIVTLSPTPTSSSSPTPDPTSNWKTYTNKNSMNYQINYPKDWVFNQLNNNIWFDSSNGKRITLTCPRTAFTETDLPNPYSWEPNEGGYTVKYLKRLTLNGNKAQQYIWTATDGSGTLNTDILRDKNPEVCTLSQQRILVKKNYEEYIKSQTDYYQILSTFKFLDQNKLTNQKNCQQDNDCTLFICSGCFNKEWAKDAPPDLACITYEGYRCKCSNNICLPTK